MTDYNMNATTMSGGGGAQGTQGASKTIFVGNIPYDATEQQVRDILSTAGRIVHIRFVYDAQSGKPKGYAFCEYLDSATAQSAIRNLNNHDLNGRSLRLDMADEDKPVTRDRKGQSQQQQQLPSQQQYTSTSTSFPQGLSSSSTDALLAILPTLTKANRIDLLLETKRFLTLNPEGGRQLLYENSLLTQLLLMIQFQFGLLSKNDFLSLLRSPTTPNPNVSTSMNPVAPLALPNIPQMPSMSVPPPMPPMPTMPTMPMQMPPMQPQLPPITNPPYSLPHNAFPSYPPQPHYTTTHIPQLPPAPIAPVSYFPQQPIAQPPPPQMGFPNENELLSKLPPAEQAVLREVLKMTPDQLQLLPPQQQQMVFGILQQMGIQLPHGR